MKDECCEGEMPPGLGSRVAVSILVFFGWLIFLVIWIFFFAGRFTLTENLGIVIVAFLVGIAILAASWASWGLKYGKKMEKWHKEHEKHMEKAAAELKKEGVKRRLQASERRPTTRRK